MIWEKLILNLATTRFSIRPRINWTLLITMKLTLNSVNRLKKLKKTANKKWVLKTLPMARMYLNINLCLKKTSPRIALVKLLRICNCRNRMALNWGNHILCLGLMLHPLNNKRFKAVDCRWWLNRLNRLLLVLL